MCFLIHVFSKTFLLNFDIVDNRFINPNFKKRYKKNANDIEEGSSDMGFQTHIFANLMNSQVAVVDAFVGESDHVSALAVYDAQLQQGGGGNIREAQ